jgi:hypothetical protein
MGATQRTRMAARRAARVERRGVDLFALLDVGPEPEGEPRREGELRQIVRRVRRKHWSAQIVLVLMAVTVAVFGLLVGTGLAGFWSP